MGNEHSKNKELLKKGKISGKHTNGSANGLSAKVRSNGVEISVNGETIVQQNSEPLSLNLTTESADFVIVESDKPADAPIISETIETITQKEEDKESNEDQTDSSRPAADPESTSSGEEVVAVIIDVHREDFEYPHPKAETSTQTDRKVEADIATQTGEDDDTTTSIEDLLDEIVIIESAAAEEEPLNESTLVIAEEVVEETANEEPSDDQTAEIISVDVVMENIVYENKLFRAERVEITDIKNHDPEGESMNGPAEAEPEIAAEPEANPKESDQEDETVAEENTIEEAEPEIAAEPEANPKESDQEEEIIAEENNIEETEPLEICCSLPKVVADCVEAVFAADPQFTGFAAVDTSEPRADEVITEDSGEGAGDTSAEVVLIETAEPESNAFTPETQEETIPEVVCEEPDPTPAPQDVPVEELPVPLVPLVPLVTVLHVKVESAHVEVTAVGVEDVPGKCEEDKHDDEASEKPDRCPEQIIVEAISNQLIIIEELPEDTVSDPDDEVEPESITEDTTTEEKAEVSEEVLADVAPERAEEAEPSPVFAKDDAEVMLEAAIDSLAQEFECSAVASREPAVVHDILLEEEVIIATTFVPLSREQEAILAIPEEPVETVAEEMNEEAIEAFSNEIEAAPESVEEDTTETVEEPADVPPTEATEESVPRISVQEELVPSDSNQVIFDEPAEESTSVPEHQPKPNVLAVILETTEDEVNDNITHKTDTSGAVSDTIEENSKDSQITTSDESASTRVEDVLETAVEEIVTDDAVGAECDHVTSEDETPEVIAEGETEEEAENQSSVNSIDSTPDSQSVITTDMEALVVRLQSACLSAVEQSEYRLSGLNISSLRYSITVSIHVAPKEEQQ